MSANAMKDPSQKYMPFQPVSLPERTWPSGVITKAPVWCSVDLRDGNQSLATPMNVEEKLVLFDLLTGIGFKEIEAGYPAASETEYLFIRRLIDEKRIPDDVTLQVISPCIESIVEKTFRAVEGAPRVIFHFLNSTSPVQRKLVYAIDEDACVALAVDTARHIRELAAEAEKKGTRVRFEYSPESFSETEPEFALRIVEAVMDALEVSASAPMIVNLPATVEVSMPNQYADLVEWFCRNAKDRKRFQLSIHPHNDRGTAIAAAELALLAGAERVEGTLFGNGERTGNADLITLALNMYTQGIQPGLDLHDINGIRDIYQKVTGLFVEPRHPYTGEFVYTAYSGTHQDAISKVLDHRKKRRLSQWHVPYLPLDPSDIGRQYDPIIRINSQSGKSGAAFVLETQFGYKIPKAMLPELGQVVKEAADRENAELSGNDLFKLFNEEFIRVETPYELKTYRTSYLHEEDEEDNEVRFTGVINHLGQPTDVEGVGNGPIDALYDALRTIGAADFDFLSYDQHALSTGSDSRAIAYIQLGDKNNRTCFGVGTSRDIRKASLRALISAINRISRA
ncbi:MAG: 2-isopropylmalate synthase [Clostridiales bacterium]|nr:2-isopropylmalate synthase [Clostridiales bacterium]